MKAILYYLAFLLLVGLVLLLCGCSLKAVLIVAGWVFLVSIGLLLLISTLIHSLAREENHDEY